MTHKVTIPLLHLVILAGLTAGCRTGPARIAPVSPYTPEVARNGVAVPPTPPVGIQGLLAPGMEVSITVLGGPDKMEFTDRIDEGGHVNLRYIGQVSIAGMTTSEAEDRIEKEYVSRRIYNSVNVLVVSKAAKYYVSGQVRSPGGYSLDRDITILQAIYEAGGFTPFADQTDIVVTRRGNTFRINGKRVKAGRDPDPPIEPGDQINVEQRWH